MIDNNRGSGHDLCLQFSKKYGLSLLSIEGRVLDWCQAFDRLASVDAHLWGGGQREGRGATVHNSTTVQVVPSKVQQFTSWVENTNHE